MESNLRGERVVPPTVTARHCGEGTKRGSHDHSHNQREVNTYTVTLPHLSSQFSLQTWAVAPPALRLGLPGSVNGIGTVTPGAPTGQLDLDNSLMRLPSQVALHCGSLTKLTFPSETRREGSHLTDQTESCGGTGCACDLRNLQMV